MTTGQAPHSIASDAPDFEAMYAADPDPWQVGTSWYERRKLALLLAALPRATYESVWEPGCGPGFVSLALAARSACVTASDVAPRAVELARTRCAGLDHVAVVRSRLPEVPLPAPVELVVVAEFLYYVRDLPEALDALWSACRPGADLLFVHWAAHPHDAPLSGAALHALVGAEAASRAAQRVVSHVDQSFLLDVYRCAG